MDKRPCVLCIGVQNCNPIAMLYNQYHQIYSLTVYEMLILKGGKTFEKKPSVKTFITDLHFPTCVSGILKPLTLHFTTSGMCEIESTYHSSSFTLMPNNVFKDTILNDLNVAL